MYDIRLRAKSASELLDDSFTVKLLDSIGDISTSRIIFWHNGDMSNKQIAEFQSKCNKTLRRTAFDIRDSKPSDHWAWFHISDKKIKRHESLCRYSANGSNKTLTVMAILNYKKMLTHIKTDNRKYRYSKKGN